MSRNPRTRESGTPGFVPTGSRPGVAEEHHGLPQPVPEWPLWLPGHDRPRGLRGPATRRTWPRSPPALAGRRGARTREAGSEPTHEAARRGSRRPLPHRGARQPLRDGSRRGRGAQPALLPRLLLFLLLLRAPVRPSRSAHERQTEI